MRKYIAIKNDIGGSVYDRLVDMGYDISIGHVNYSNWGDVNVNWIFIIIKDTDQYGQIIVNFNYSFEYSTDIKVDIEDIPLRKDLDEFVKVLNEGEKMGLL